MERKIFFNKGIIINNFASHTESVESVFRIWKSQGYCIVNYLYWASYPLIDSNSLYLRALEQSDIIFPDGIGLYIYAKVILNYKLNNLNGTELNPLFISEAEKRNVDFAFYGAESASIAKASEKINKNYKKLYFYQDGYKALEWPKIKEDSILFVGLGSPAQEIWVSDNIEKIKRKKILVITVGGYFDFLSGKYKRAPNIILKLKSEWLWRAPHCDRKRNLRNLLIFYYIIRDFFVIRKLNK